MHLNYTNCQILASLPHGALFSWLVFFSFLQDCVVDLRPGVTSPAGLVFHCLSSLKGPLGRCLSEYNKVDESR